MTNAEYDLRFAVVTKENGSVEMMYFQNPQDPGTTIKLTPKEREQLAFALAKTGFHPITRDEGK